MIEKIVSDFFYTDCKLVNLEVGEYFGVDLEEDKMIVEMKNYDKLIKLDDLKKEFGIRKYNDLDNLVDKFLEKKIFATKTNKKLFVSQLLKFSSLNNRDVNLGDIDKISSEFFLNEIYTTFIDCAKNENFRFSEFFFTTIYFMYLDLVIKDDLKSLFIKIASNTQQGIPSLNNDFAYVLVKNNELSELERYYNTSIIIRNAKEKSEFVFINYSIKNDSNNHSFILDNDINYLDLQGSGARRYEAILCKINLHSLYESYKKSKNNLFDLNLRFFVKKEQVDQSIMKSLILNRDDFHILHNGITMICEEFSLGDNKIVVQSPSIVNGAQTVSNIYNCVLNNYLSDRDLKNGYVVCKIIKISREDTDFINLISIAANTQKPIKYYESYVNSEELMKLQEYYREYKILLILKSGEVNALYKYSVPLLKIAKILRSAVNQEPGSAYNALSSKLFESYFESYFVTNMKIGELKNNMLTLVLAIYFLWSNFMDKINITYVDLKSYGEMLYISFVMFELFEEVNTIDDLNESGIMNFSDFEELKEKIGKKYTNEYINDFVVLYSKEYDKLKEEQPGQQMFKNNELYKNMILAKYKDEERIQKIKEKIEELYIWGGENTDESC